MSFGMLIIWWLVASALLWQTWNRVIGSLFKVKSAKFWQALLLLGTVCVFCAPRCYLHSSHCGKWGSHSAMSDDEMGTVGEAKGNCPFAKHNEKGSSNEKPSKSQE